MTPERLREIELLFHEARERAPAERDAFLARTCADDPTLRREVESLLAQPPAGVIDATLSALVAELVAPPVPRLAPGSSVGPYRIERLLAVGGMGEVYRARDTTLGRDVAIKILPRHFTADPERLARFEREARMLAALNHPNIGAIYGLEAAAGGVRALVLELVEGETVADRIQRGPVPVTDALTIACQIADALEAAHEKGIIHRDLKPANIKVTLEGSVKVLDFGLAKALAPATEDVPTPTAIPTQVGVVMGTPAYMSPEQARGEAPSRQADIWSFGVVLYELLTGISPFGRQTTAETLASVLGTQPDYSVLPSETPANARHLVRRCLEKDRRRRLQHMGDVRIEVEEALAALTAEAVPGATDGVATTGRIRRAAGAIALAVLAGVAGWWLAHRFALTTPAAVVRLSIPFGGPLNVAYSFGVRHLAISADGSRVAYVSATRLSIRQIGQKEAVGIEVTAANPFFSPNGEWVGFFEPGVGLKKVPVLGGTPVSIVTTPQRPGGGTWRADGTIVFATSEGLFQVSEKGGDPRLLVKPDPGRKQLAYAWPQFMPGGQSVLFTIVPTDSIDGAQIAVLDLKTLEPRVVLSGGSAAHYAATGHLVYASRQILKGVAFDPQTQQTRGDPVSLSDIEIASAPDNGAAEFAVSETGTLLFLTPSMSSESLRTVSWVDRQGKEEPLALAPGRYAYPHISPDGTRVALDIYGANRDIWIWDLQRSSLTKLTSGPTEDMTPAWSRDGSRVFFASNRTGHFELYSQAADGATGERMESSGPSVRVPVSFTPDGTRLLLLEDFKDISILNLARPDRLEPLLHNEFSHGLAVVSPDGNWVAYESNESGNRFEIFLRPFPNVSGRREKVSIDGGRYPLWGPQGSGELFYVDLNGGMMAASVKLSPGLNLGRVTKLFDWEKPSRGISGMPNDISPLDGRFLMVKHATTNPAAVIDISVVLNWFEELRERVPVRAR